MNMDYESVIELLPPLYSTNVLYIHKVLKNAEQQPTPEQDAKGV